VWRLDRLARNAQELYKILERVQEAGAQFKSLTEHFDFTTSMGQFVLGILALVAQLEAQMTAQRTKAGMAALRERGYKLGAPRRLNDDKAREIVKQRKAGATIASLAKRYRVSTGSIHNYLRRARVRKRR